jgi:hypothetical protein
MFANWADFPSIAITTDGTWVVHWLEKTAAMPYAYHARVSHSSDRGLTWSDPVTIHSDRSATEHGFVSMVPGPDGTVDMAWLDGRATGEQPRGAMQVRSGVLAYGQVIAETMVDDRVCDCCQTALARTSSGLVAAYRDRSKQEIRDIAVRVNQNGAWSDPIHVGEDGWHIEACPVNGPALATIDNNVAIAWFTAPEREEKVQVAFSENAGQSFGPPIRVDVGAPLGRVDIEFLDDSTALAVWLERVGEDAEIMGVTISAGGTLGHPVVLASTSQARQSGFPRLARSGSELLIAHRALGPDGGTIRVLKASIDR